MSGADRHLSEEELSDLVDGQAGPDATQHAAECAACAARLDGWRSISTGLASLRDRTPVPAGRRAEAVSAALDASGGAGRRPGRYLRPVSAAAAAAAVVVGIGFGLAELGHSGSVKSSSSAATTSGAAASGSRPGVPSAVNLGVLGGSTDVSAAVDRVLGSGGFAKASAPGTAANSSGAASSEMTPSAGATSCVDTGRLFAGSSPRLILTAGALYRGTQSVVYVYQVGASRWAVVTDARTCAVLAEVKV